jgi:hypothetical protein
VSYEALRARLRQALADALPVDVHGHRLVDGAVSAVLEVLYPDPIEPKLSPDTQAAYDIPVLNSCPGDRWPCGCSTLECRLQWAEFSTGAVDPTITSRVTCLTHSLHGSSLPSVVGDGGRRQAQALYQLGVAHQQDCH